MSKLFKRVLSVAMVLVMILTLFFANCVFKQTEVKAATNSQTLGAGSIGTVVNSNDQSYVSMLPSTTNQNSTRFTTDNYNNNNPAIDTNDWASNWLWDLEGDRIGDSTGALTGTAYAFPLSFLMKTDGLRVTKPSMTSNSTNISAYNIKDNDTLGDFNIKPNWTAGIAEIDNVTDWSYEGVVENASNASQTMRITMTQGSPFTFIELNNSNVISIEKLRVTFPSNVVYSGVYNGCLMYVFECQDLVGFVNGYPTTKYQYYAAYFPESTTVSSLGTSDTTGNDQIGTLQFTLPSDRTYMSFAWLCEGSAENDSQALSVAQEYRPYAFNFISDTKADYSYNESTSKITTDYTYSVEKKAESTADGTVMGVLPHQYKNMSGYSYMSHQAITLRGYMKFIKGSSYTTTMNYDGILPFMPALSEDDTTGQTTLQNYVNDWVKQYMSNPGSWNLTNEEVHDTYYQGKKINRSAQVLAAAKTLGDEDNAELILAALQKELEDWFTYSGSNDSTYFTYKGDGVGVLLGFPTSFNAADQFNDHHFHYGYFIQSAACVGLWDKAWLEDYKDVVKQLVYDIASPYRNQKDCEADCGNAYPYLRSFSPYEGHSWASGYADERTGNNQESTSEAINAWAGIILFGEMIGDDEIRDLGIYLYTTEIEAANNYWFDHDKDIYTTDDSKYEQVMASMVWGGKADYATWFGIKYTQGIQICPMQSWSFYLLQGGADYIKEFYNHDKNSSVAEGGSTGEWNDMWAAYYALADPETAMNSVWTKTAVNDGDSIPHTYHYIQSMIDYGTPDLTFTADSTLSTVFNKDGKYTYAVYNPTSNAQTVKFTSSTGETVSVVASPNEMTLFDSEDIGKATYNVEYYGKNLSGNGYSLIDSSVKYADAGSTASLTAKNITGYSYESNNGSNVTSAVVNADGSTTLKFYYTRNTYTVSYNLNGGTKNNSELYPSSYTFGEVYTLDSPKKDGYTFMGWYLDENFSETLPSITAKTYGNMTLYARWALEGTIFLNDTVYLEFDSDINGKFTIIGDTGYDSVNVLYKLYDNEADAKSDYENKSELGFVSWGMDKTSAGWEYNTSFSGNKGQYIVFYFIRYDANGGYKTNYAYGQIGASNVSPEVTTPSTEVETTSQEQTTQPGDTSSISAPTGLTYAGNTDLPYYFAWAAVTNAVSYNIYVNGTLVGNAVGSSYNIDSNYFTTNGDYTIGVTAINSAGAESTMTTTVYTVTNGSQVETPEPTTTTPEPTTTTPEPTTTTPEPTTTTPEPTTEPEVDVPTKPVAPIGLTYAGNTDLPYYFAWQTVADVVSYNVYVNDTLVGNAVGGSYNIDSTYFATAGVYTISVTSVDSTGVESDKTTISYTVNKDTEVETTKPEDTTSEDTTTKEEETTSPSPSDVTISDDVKVEGYQISSTAEGSRVVGSVEPSINGKNVVNWGFVYSIIEVNGIALDVTEADMYVGSDNAYVQELESTSLGTSSYQMGTSTTATYFVRTTLFSVNTASYFSAKYKVRAYAVLEDGTYLYSDVSSYSIFDIAEKLYKNKLMNTYYGHSYLYNNILSIVDSSYEEVDYNWTNIVVKPSDIKK